jgi:hypothetical protein
VIPLLLALAANATVVTCSVTGDAHARVYELQRTGDGERARWLMVMRSREAGASPVVLPLPDAKPVVTDRRVALDYRTLNGGRNVKWTVDAAGAASLDVYTNFELEVNIEADLDPRVELMNTEGAIANLSCEIAPKRSASRHPDPDSAGTGPSDW